MSEFSHKNREEIIHDFLNKGPRSEEWRQWRESLETRLKRMKRERAEMEEGADKTEIDEKINEIENQLNALATEEIISEFVEAEIDLSLSGIESEEEWEE